MAIQLQACGPGTVRSVSRTDQEPVSHAGSLVREGNYRQAAAEYQQLAELYPDRSAEFQLQAAEAWYIAGEMENATVAAAAVGDQTRDQQIETRLGILEARIDIARNKPYSALERLRSLPLENVPGDYLEAIFETRSQAFEQLGNPGSASRERVALERYLKTQAARVENNRRIWENLNQMNADSLQRLRASSSDSLRGWIELALINQTMLLNPRALDTAVSLWNEQYPGHPAEAISAELLNESQINVFRPSRIALLLPFDGQYRQVAEAIRDGFLAAWYESTEYRPILSIYSANALNILDSYQQAVADGAEYIVGPLEREAVAQLTSQTGLPVKVLALNQYGAFENNTLPDADQNRIPPILQFGLLPEDEARQAAVHAFQNGHRNALLISRNEDYDRRVYQSFLQEWSNLGGRVISQIFYNPSNSDFSTPVRELLNVSNSEQRAATLQQRLNRSLRTETRLRDDADMIFLVARPEEARQLLPQLRFYRADSLPVYSSSRVYAGIINPQLDRDLDDIIFTDSPWVLAGKQSQTELQKSLNRNWQAEQSSYNRFYAFGIDAFGLIPHLGRLIRQNTVPYHGETGDLYLNSSGIINRKLAWARFKDGIAVLAEP